MIRYSLKLLALFIVILLSVSCNQENLNAGDGFLKGKIKIGPLCPVESVPPNPACEPTAETYKAWATAVWTLNRRSIVDTLNPQLDGFYKINIPAGNYVIDFAQRNFNYPGHSNLPAIVTIAVGDTTKFDVNIDTGIR